MGGAAAAAGTRGVARASVALGLACDGACVFCAQQGLAGEPRDEEAIGQDLARAAAEGAGGVTFVGGEPARDARLESWVSRAREAGFARVGVQTNGVALAAPGRVAALARAGLTDLHLSIHGAEARVHDWLTGTPGSFDAALRTLGAARGAGLDVVVATVVARPNFRVLGPVPRLLASRGVAAWCAEVPAWRGAAAAAADRVIPRLALALPFVLHALDGAASIGLPAFVRGAPACLLGPFASRALPATRSYGRTCDGCPARPGCPGVDLEYLARHGEGELSPCPAVGVDAQGAAWRDLFVGVGPTAAPAVAPGEAPPSRARVALPMLGRPAPGRSESPAGAPRLTGEALRAILPGLFGDPTRPDES